METAHYLSSIPRAKKSWVTLSLFYLVITAILGITLRYFFVGPVNGLNYKFILHAHSHIGILGWVYSSLFIAFIKFFLLDEQFNSRKYKILFWLTQISIIGMLITFPIQGYAIFSITFSTLHILLSYWFAFQFLKDLKENSNSNSHHPIPIKFIKASIFFMVISSIGPWSLGFIMAKGLTSSFYYPMSIYYYLHFQYNGWFLFALVGLFLTYFEKNEIYFKPKHIKNIFHLMFYSTIPAYLLSALWLDPPTYIFIISFFSAGIQLIALVLLLKLIIENYKQIKMLLLSETKIILTVSMISLIVKQVLQWFSSFIIIFELRDIIIAYLHLTLIGVITLFIIGLFIQLKWFQLKTKLAKTGLGIFVTGFILSEILLFLNSGLLLLKLETLHYFFPILFIISTLLPIGITLFYYRQLSNN